MCSSDLRIANGTTGQVLTATTSGAPSWKAASTGSVTLLSQQSGTANTSGGATTVATYAVSGLAATDVLWTILVAEDWGVETYLYSTTDSIAIGDYQYSAGSGSIGMVYVGVTSSSSLTSYNNRRIYNSATSSAVASMTTNFTGSWTAAVRTAGAGNASVKWQWYVFKIAGA